MADLESQPFPRVVAAGVRREEGIRGDLGGISEAVVQVSGGEFDDEFQLYDNSAAFFTGGVIGDDLVVADNAFASISNLTVDDTIEAGTGNDTVFGGTGSDQITITEDDGTDTISGGENLGDDDNIVFFEDGATGIDVSRTGNEAGDYLFVSGNGDGSFTDIETVTITNQDDTYDGTATTGGMGVVAGAGDDSRCFRDL